MMSRRATALGLSLAIAWAAVVRAELRFDAETGFVYESNLSNSDKDAEREADWAWRTDLSVSQGLQISRNLRATIVADLLGQVWDHYEGFTQIGGGLTTALRYRFGLGREAPWLSLENRIGYDRFHETFRSGWDEVVRFRGGFAISERIALEGGYTFENFTVPDNFFDVQSHSADVRVISDLTSFLQLAVGYVYREGDVISYAIPPRPEIARFAIEREDVATFGTDPVRTAYRFRGQTHSVIVSVGCAVTKHTSIQVEYEYGVTLHDPLEYQNHFVGARLAYSF